MACLSLPTALSFSSRVTVKNCFIVCYHPVESENTKSYQPPNLRCQGMCLLGGSHKNQDTRYVHMFLSQRYQHPGSGQRGSTKITLISLPISGEDSTKSFNLYLIINHQATSRKISFHRKIQRQLQSTISVLCLKLFLHWLQCSGTCKHRPCQPPEAGDQQMFPGWKLQKGGTRCVYKFLPEIYW